MTSMEKEIDPIMNAILEGNHINAVGEAKKLLENGIEKVEIVSVLEKAMRKLDEKCTIEHFNLLEIMLAGRAVMSVMNVLYPPGSSPPLTKGTIAIASLEGDIHDLGKGIVIIILLAYGYKAVDCGKDCPVENLIDTAEREKVDAIFVSGLITPVIPKVQRIKEVLKERKLNIKVVAGGAALKQSSAEKLNVDFVAETAFDGLRFLKKHIGNRDV